MSQPQLSVPLTVVDQVLSTLQDMDVEESGFAELHPLPGSQAAPSSVDTNVTNAPSTPEPNLCHHERTTTRGTNGYYRIVTCLDCNRVIQREKKTGVSAFNPSAEGHIKEPAFCRHHRVTWRGSNGINWRNTCLDCGKVTKGRWDDKTFPGTGVRPPLPADRDFLLGAIGQPVTENKQYDMNTIQEIVRSAVIVAAIRAKENNGTLGLEELHRIIDATAVNINLFHPQTEASAPQMAEPPRTPPRASRSDSMRSPMARSPPISSTTPERDQLNIWGQKLITFGKYKGQPYWYAWQDQEYVRWCLSQVGPGGGLKDLVTYLKEKLRIENVPLGYLDFESGYMAFETDPSDENPASENWMIAILDSGCNRTCHGDRWMQRYMKATNQDISDYPVRQETCSIRGISGNVSTQGIRRLEVCFELKDAHGSFAVGTLDSTELSNSDAPLLLSIRDQRRLQLQLDLTGDTSTVYSKLFGGHIKVTEVNGLLGLHLLPSQVALLADRENDDTIHEKTDLPAEAFETPETFDLANEDTGSLPPTTEPSPSSRSSSTASPSSSASTSSLEVHLDMEKENVKTLTKGQKKQLKDDIYELEQKDTCMWSHLRGQRHRTSLPRGCRVFLMEIFAGAAVLTTLAMDMGLSVAAPVDLHLDGSDLLRPSVRSMLEQEINDKDPYVITFSPVCGPFGPWSNLNMSKSQSLKERITAERESWHPFLQWLRKIIRQRLQRGRKILVENPWTSALWDTYSMRQLFAEELSDGESLEPLELIRCDQCQFGLRDWDNGQLHKKPTGFLTASAPVKERLNQLCDQLHDHQVLEGGQRTKRAQEWPEPLCRAMLDGFLDDLSNRTMVASFYTEDIQERNAELDMGLLDSLIDEKDLAPRQDLRPHRLSPEEMHRQELMEEQPPPTESAEMAREQDRRARWLKIPRPTRLALRRLHNMTGHSPVSGMMQLLRTACASPSIIEACKHFACESCRKHMKIEKPNVTKIPGKPTFNHEVSLDCFEVRDGANNRHTVLSAVDLGTLYHQAWWVAGGGVPKSSICAEAFLNGWIMAYGPPHSVVCDRGMHNQGRMKDLLRIHGIMLRYTGVEAPFQLGRGERQGGLFKELLYAAMEERQVIGVNQVKTLIGETCVVKNMKLNHHGFTPYKWVLGKLPVDVTSLTTEESEGRYLGIHDNVLEPEEEFGIQLQVRQAAKAAFTKVDASRRIRAALLRKSTPLRGPYQQGDLVCFHRRGRWHGPGRIIGRDGRAAVWIIHGGIPLVAPESSLRPASASEVYAKQLMELRPSRKRAREAMTDARPDHNPFADDYQLGSLHDDGEHQPGYVEIPSSAGPAPDGDDGNEEYTPTHGPPDAAELPTVMEEAPEAEMLEPPQPAPFHRAGTEEPEGEHIPDTPLQLPWT